MFVVFLCRRKNTKMDDEYDAKDNGKTLNEYNNFSDKTEYHVGIT